MDVNWGIGWSGLVILFLVVAFLINAIRIFREYERGVVFSLGRFWKVKGPGLVIIVPIIQQAVRDAGQHFGHGAARVKRPETHHGHPGQITLYRIMVTKVSQHRTGG